MNLFTSNCRLIWCNNEIISPLVNFWQRINRNSVDLQYVQEFSLWNIRYLVEKWTRVYFSIFCSCY